MSIAHLSPITVEGGVYAPATSTRTLNSVFTPNATKAVFVNYTIQITCSATIASSQTGKVELRSDTATTPTTARCAVENTNAIGLGVGIGITNTQSSSLAYLVPPGHKVTLVSSGTGTITILNQTEVTLF